MQARSLRYNCPILVTRLHFEFLNSAISRHDYCKKLAFLPKNSHTMYDDLLKRQVDAIKNVKRLLKQYSPPTLFHDNPSTTVFLLVEELNKSREM